MRNIVLSVETRISMLDLFGAQLPPGDHKARMDLLLYGSEHEAALRAAKRLGAGQVALAKARIAAYRKASNTKALLEAVPHELHGDPGYMFSKIQLLRREEKFAEAAQLMMSAPKDPGRLYNLDEWWIERRLLSRKMLDIGERRTAYLIARDAALPARDIYKTEQEFTAGWIALRFLTDPATAAQHFARIGVGSLNPAALNRGLPFDFYAYPVTGIPPFKSIGPEVEQSIIFAIARQESAFNPAVVSPAQAYGLMQVTPDAGRYVCKKYGASFDLGRMKTDPVYNAALGAAELGGLIEDYRGSYIMTFAAYNAGRGSVKKWIERYGDPRDPKVDAVDWVELIPFSETRNYVQRIMENLQVYRARFGGGTRLQIDAALRRGASVE